MENPYTFSRRLLRWYRRSRRDLPWRVASDSPPKSKPHPYHVLVSEAMLQQTQVATVIPYFHRFLAAFPTIQSLAEASEQEVLRLWQGLGYYSRARNLRAAAKVVVDDFAGQLPTTVDALRSLPGVGRYTAGAVASIAFDERAPIVDGNVARVLCRLDKIETDPRDRATAELLWTRAAEILPKKHVGDFNSAMMELGATVCLPRNPQCLVCPVQQNCLAFQAGIQDRIPLPRKRKPVPFFNRWVFCLHRASDNRWLVEQRPAKGRWAGLWQFIAMEQKDGSTPQSTLNSAFNFSIGTLQELGTVHHTLTHRKYRFDVFSVALPESSKIAETDNRKWLTLDELNQYPLPKPHVQIARMLAGHSD